MPPQPLDATPEQVAKADAIQQQQAADTPKKFPKGVVLGKDGKPCRSCTSFASWAAMTKKTTTSPSTISTSTPPAESTAALNPPADCPPDVDELGRSTWTLLHSMTATYPVSPSTTQQNDVRQFVSLFSRLYPCWVCADDFRNWMKEDGNAPRVSSRDEFGKWMCEAHNAVNVKLGKKSFDCGKWEERWRTGWKDGRCD
ncbi:augmenter of liver regeneration [Cryomyces antarcticus]